MIIDIIIIVIRIQIYVPPPDDLSRKQIFENQLLNHIPCKYNYNNNKENNKVENDEIDSNNEFIDMNELITKTIGYSGAEVVACCTEAAILAISRYNSSISITNNQPQHNDEVDRMYVTRIDIITAIESIKPQITNEMLIFYNKFAQQNLI